MQLPFKLRKKLREHTKGKILHVWLDEVSDAQGNIKEIYHIVALSDYTLSFYTAKLVNMEIVIFKNVASKSLNLTVKES